MFSWELTSGGSPAAGARRESSWPVLRRSAVLRLVLCLLLCLAGFAPALHAQPSDAPETAGAAVAEEGEGAPVLTRVVTMEITPQTERSLERLQDTWDQWVVAYYQGAGDQSPALVDQMIGIARELGLPHLPDLAFAAQVRAVESARDGDFERAAWALDAASRLDPTRPENDFARGHVAWLEGRYPASILASARGAGRLLTLPVERRVTAFNVLLWVLGVLLVAGVCYLALQMAAKGGCLLRDLLRLLGGFLPSWAAYPLAVALLIWPILLPYGPLWLLLLWSVLLWGYGSPSERGVFIVTWVLLGAAPLVMGEARGQVDLELSPAVEAVESIRAGRLYGDLFLDLEELQSALPDSVAVEHLLADVHRGLGQWDRARSLYGQVLAREPQRTSVLLNLGAYYFFINDFGSSVDQFRRAAEANPQSAAAYFNLSQAYSEQYHFEEGQAALAQARALDNDRVNAWLRRTDAERIVIPAGGVARVPEIRAALARATAGAREGGQGGSLRALIASLSAVLGLIIVAVALHMVRRPFGYAEPPIDLAESRSLGWRLGRALVPGLRAAELGDGGRAFASLFVPVGLLLLPIGGGFLFTLPLGFDVGAAPFWVIAVVGLVIFFGVRIVRALVAK